MMIPGSGRHAQFFPVLHRLQRECHWRTRFSAAYHHHPLTDRFDPASASASSNFNSYSNSNPCFALLGFCDSLLSLSKIHGLLIVHGLTGSLPCDTKLVSLYGQYGRVHVARQVFDHIPHPDLYSSKVMLRWYFLNDAYDHVVSFYTLMRSNLRREGVVEPLDNVIFSVVLKACSVLRDFDEGRKLHCHVVKVGNPDSFVLTGLVDMYAKCGEIGCARSVFDDSTDRNIVSWTSMITAYVQNDCSEQGLLLFNRLRQCTVEVNQFTLGSVIMACAKLGALHQGKWAHGFVIKNGIDLHSSLSTSLLDMYVKQGAIRDARSVFDEFPAAIDLVSWTAMIVGYGQNGLHYEALKLFVDKRKLMGLLPNEFTAASVLSTCAQSCNLNMGRLVHGLGIVLGLTTDASVTNALVDMYAKCNIIHDAHRVFKLEAVSAKNVVSWNSMIYGHARNGFAYEALQLFHQMRLECFLPDAVTLVSVVVAACAALGTNIQVCSPLHAFSLKNGLLSSSVYVGTTILHFYAKCGYEKSSRMLFDEMGEKNTITWSAMIHGHGVHGDSGESLALFSDMLKEDLKPNEAVFTTILSACSHTGMVEKGWRYFTSMCEDYNIVPSMKHYACMVDLLARSGRLEEAWDFIEKMPVQPEVSVFGAFLKGCETHMRFDLGNVAAKRMLNLHPSEASYYVLVSNMFAANERWSEANKLRELMKQRGLSKSLGSSRLVGEYG